MAEQAKFDQDLRKAFQELQMLVADSTQKIRVAEYQIEQLKNTITRTRLTEKELDNLPAETRTYEAVGRMFLYQPVGTVQEHLTEKTRVIEAKVKAIEKNKRHWENAIKEHENSIREMLIQRHK